MKRANVLSALVVTAGLLGCTPQDPNQQSQALGGGPKPTLATPTLSSPGSTKTTITVRVCAGADGAPAGFSLQWQTAADFAQNGWSDVNATYCAASFSGVPNGSRFALGPNECTDVEIGALAAEVGASWNDGCNAGLLCGTDYVFRSFAHANSTWSRSAFTPTYTFSTAACDNGCTLTQGYWKNHADAWPVAGLTLGAVAYTEAQLLDILGAPVEGNGLISLAHQLIAAKLNVASGANPAAIAATIAAADALIGGLVVPPIGAGYLAPATTSALTTALDNYNNGLTGPGHCE
jgi:hypothetical protein